MKYFTKAASELAELLLHEPPMQVITLFLAFDSLNFTDKQSYQCIISGYIAGFRAEMYMKELIRQKMIKYRFG